MTERPSVRRTGVTTAFGAGFMHARLARGLARNACRGMPALALVVVTLATGCGTSATLSSTSTAGAHPVAFVHVPACPARNPTTMPSESWAPARATLAPLGATLMRICRYAGLNDGHPLALIATGLVSSSRSIAAIARELDRLPPFPTGALSCPMDDGSALLIYLGYRQGQTVTIGVALTGCGGASNGSVTRWAGNSDAVTQLERLAHRV